MFEIRALTRAIKLSTSLIKLRVLLRTIDTKIPTIIKTIVIITNNIKLALATPGVAQLVAHFVSHCGG